MLANGLFMVFDCIGPPVTCDAPMAPSLGSVNANGQPYTEGLQVTYQCAEGLFPMGVLNTTCTRDRQNGVWEPDPSSVVCRTSPGNVIFSLTKY